FDDIPGFLKKYFNFPNDEFPEVRIYSPLLGCEIGHVPHVTNALQLMLTGGMLIFRWFTDGAKSKTGTFFFPITSLAAGPDEAHILCTDNFDDAKRRVQQLERELETNTLLLEDFPWLRRATRSKTGSALTWSRREFTISGRSTNRPDPSMYAASVSAGDVRQRRGKLIMDDIEGKDARVRASVRKELYDFVKLEAIRCWEDTAESKRPLICAMGTPYDIDSIYIKLPQENPDYTVITVPAYTQAWDKVSKWAYPKLGDGTRSNVKTPWEERAKLLPDKLFTWPRKRMKITKQDPMFGKNMTKLQFFLAYLLDPSGGDPMRLSSDQLRKLVENAPLEGDGAWITVVTLDPAAGVEEDYCGISAVRIRWPKEDKLPQVQLLEAHRFEQGLIEQTDFAADLCWKYPETEEGQFKGRPCRLIYENNAMQGGTYKNSFSHRRPEIRLVPVYTGSGKFDTEMGLTVIRTLVKQERLGVPESQIESEGIQTFLTEVRDLGSEREHDHISASVWFVVTWLWKQVRAMNQNPINPMHESKRFSSARPGFFRARTHAGGTRWRR
ncbi:MAG TPA: hypothetical protein VFD88_10700, partial [Clostridia bacterium]|nr:hypothetical protein [Clostridia bacterium]